MSEQKQEPLYDTEINGMVFKGECPEKLTRVCVPALDAILGVPYKVLDKGFVRCVDYMGGDESIVQAARVSYGKGTKKLSEDEGLIRYLQRHWHCYDAETEVLTDVGFVRWPDVQECHRLGVWDRDRGTLCYEKPEYLTRDHYSGQMYRVDHGGVSLLVTPQHSMYVKQKIWNHEQKIQEWDQIWRIKKAVELGDAAMVRYCKIAPLLNTPEFSLEYRNHFPECDDTDALLRLCGFFIGDGYAAPTFRNGISFHLKKSRKREYIQELAVSLGWELTNSLDGTSFHLKAPDIGKIFRSYFYSADGEKTIPIWMRMLNQKDSISVLDGLRNSDGTEKRSTWSYATSVEYVAHAIQLLALHAGEAAHISRNCQDMWHVMFLSRMTHPIVNQGRRNTSMQDYDGIVYCAKTRTGILVVRREGKIVLSGNTTPTEMCEIKFHIRCPMDCFRQWIRHRTASTNEYSTRYSEAIDDRQCTAPDEWRLQSGTNRQGSGGVVTEWPKDMIPVDLECKKSIGDGTPGGYLSVVEKQFHADAATLYQERLKFGVAKEVARKDLPLSTYTEAYWKIDLHNLLHFLSLRMDSHAQLEIRSYANVIGDIVAKWCPLTWAAFNDYHPRRNTVVLTARDKKIIQQLHVGGNIKGLAVEFGWLERDENGKLKTNRERSECNEKLLALGLDMPRWENLK